MEKTCCMCKKCLPIENFKQNSIRKDNLQSQCIKCQKEYRRNHYLKNRKKYIDKAASWRIEFVRWWKTYKKQFYCIECGESHPACIHFHHPNNDKEDNVSVIAFSGSRKKLLKEISKCISLCANCHAKRHWKEK
jgi:hypothetical protein